MPWSTTTATCRRSLSSRPTSSTYILLEGIGRGGYPLGIASAPESRSYSATGVEPAPRGLQSVVKPAVAGEDGVTGLW